MIDNDNLELKKRSRRRLVGAAALALIAAIVLPMVMDDEPGVPVQDIQVTIPDREADSLLARPIGGRTLVPVEPQAAPAPFEQAPGESAVLGEDVIDEAVAPAPLAAVPEARQPAASAASKPVAPEAKPAAANDEPAPTPTREPAPPPAAGKDDEAARVKAILEGRLGGETVARTQSYVVQVGAFSETATASSLSADLRGRGFKAFTEEAGAVTRVRVGPYGSRDEAEKAAERLAAQGLKAVVTAR